MAKLKIDVNDLHKYYGENEVLKGITAKFYEGDVVCIIGPSGSGKSTFLRTRRLMWIWFVKISVWSSSTSTSSRT